MPSVVIKSYYQSSIRRFCQESPLFERLQDRVCQVYGFPNTNFSLFYQDDEDDWISLSCDEDFTHAISINKVVRIKIVNSETAPINQFLQHTSNQDIICSMTKNIINSPDFDEIVKQMLPNVIRSLKHSPDAPKLELPKPQPPKSPSHKTRASRSMAGKKQEKEETKQKLSDFREEMAELDLVGTNPALLQSIIHSKEKQEEDSFVIVEEQKEMRTSQPRPRSMNDILTELGFTDVQYNQKLIQYFKGDIDKVLDALVENKII